MQRAAEAEDAALDEEQMLKKAARARRREERAAAKAAKEADGDSDSDGAGSRRSSLGSTVSLNMLATPNILMQTSLGPSGAGGGMAGSLTAARQSTGGVGIGTSGVMFQTRGPGSTMRSTGTPTQRCPSSAFIAFAACSLVLSSVRCVCRLEVSRAFRLFPVSLTPRTVLSRLLCVSSRSWEFHHVSDVGSWHAQGSRAGRFRPVFPRYPFTAQQRSATVLGMGHGEMLWQGPSLPSLSPSLFHFTSRTFIVP